MRMYKRGSPLGFLFDFLLAMQSSPRRHRQELLHHCMIDKWTGRLKTRGENVRILSLIYFRLRKHTHWHTQTWTDTLRMLCFLAFATTESDIFTLAAFCFEYLSLPFRCQTASSLSCGYMTCEKVPTVCRVQSRTCCGYIKVHTLPSSLNTSSEATEALKANSYSDK